MNTKHLTLIFLSFFLCFNSYSQTKKPPVKKTNEIDRLAKKYENSEGYMFTTIHGNIPSKISIKHNDASKPFEITLSGRTENDEALKEVVYTLITEKIKKGYKSPNEYETFGYDDINNYGIYNYTLWRGNYYFKITAEKKWIPNPEHPGWNIHVTEFFITNGDINRINSKSSKVDF